jgi:HK97 family phage major capsid protein
LAQSGMSLRTEDGSELRAFAPGESVRQWYSEHGKLGDTEPGMTLGRVLRAMVTGPRNDAERRALAEGTDSTGGYTVPVGLLAEFIDLLRAKSTVIESGARTVPLETSKTSIATVKTDPIVSWRSENALVPESEPAFDAVTFTARSLGCRVPVSRELLQDSINMEELLPTLLARVVAQEIDRVALVGTGVAPQPKGIANFGIGSVAAGGALTSYDKLLDVLQTLKEANANEPYTYIMAPMVEVMLGKLKEATTNAPLPIPPALQNVLFKTTTQVPTDLGTGNDESIIIGGNFAEVWIGVRMEAVVEVLKELYAANYQYAFMVSMRADIQLAHVGSFCKLTGITAT